MKRKVRDTRSPKQILALKKKAKKNSKPYVLYSLTKQKGKSKTRLDKDYKALPPGKRISKNGNVYYEYRKNRTDKKGKRL